MASHRNKSPSIYLPGTFMQEPDKSFTDEFRANADAVEGIGGCHEMGSTRFENTQTRGDIVRPRHGEDVADNSQDTGLDSQSYYARDRY